MKYYADLEKRARGACHSDWRGSERPRCDHSHLWDSNDWSPGTQVRLKASRLSVGWALESQPLFIILEYFCNHSRVLSCLRWSTLRSFWNKKRLPAEETSTSMGHGNKLGLQCVERRLECAIHSLPTDLFLPRPSAHLNSHNEFQIFRAKSF